uniref:Uncharacterized protein n=1 Tax=Rhizophora mucronata TaxID=61149 RepID=A0A2P2P207_RHIMU
MAKSKNLSQYPIKLGLNHKIIKKPFIIGCCVLLFLLHH